MLLTSGVEFCVRHAEVHDLAAVKALADQHRHELGFVLLPSLREQIEKGEMLVAESAGQVIGFVDYHIRRDKQLTLYHIAVSPAWQQQGVGQALVSALRQRAVLDGGTRILLKCPVDLHANRFYQSLGFSLEEIQNGRKRPLNVWSLPLDPVS